MAVQVVVIVKDVAVSIGIYISSRPACFLYIVFQGIRYFIVDHEADIALVHAHSESRRGDDNAHTVVHEIILCLDFLLDLHLTMKCLGLQTVLRQTLGDFFRFPGPCDIDDSRAPAIIQKASQCGIFLVVAAIQHRIMKIGPGGVRRIKLQFQIQPVSEIIRYVADYLGLGSSREARYRNRRRLSFFLLQLAYEISDMHVFYAEILPPS